jgi:hypothetical protein
MADDGSCRGASHRCLSYDSLCHIDFYSNSAKKKTKPRALSRKPHALNPALACRRPGRRAESFARAFPVALCPPKN